MKRNHLSQHNALHRYGIRHAQAALNSFEQLSRAPLTTFITCLVIGITLALPMALYVILKNVDIVGQKLQQSTEITVYLKQDVTEDQTQHLAHSLQTNHLIQSLHVISPNEGLKELEHTAGTLDLLAEIRANPLPWAIAITPVASQNLAQNLNDLAIMLRTIPQVESAQLDSLWVQRLVAITHLSHRLVYAFGLLFSLAVLLIVNNCIRAATQFHEKEIEVIKIIGGTRSFIRRPFLYAGMLYGLLGGIIAWQLVDIFLIWLERPVQKLSTLYHHAFSLSGLSVDDTFSLLGLSIFLGCTGSWFAVTRYLQTKQRGQ